MAAPTTFRYSPWLPGIDFHTQIETLDQANLSKLEAGVQSLVDSILDLNDRPRRHKFGLFAGIGRRSEMSKMTADFDALCAEVGITVDMPVSLVDSQLRASRGASDIGERLAFLLWANICDAKLRSSGHIRYGLSVTRRWTAQCAMSMGIKVPKWLSRPPSRQRDTMTMIAVLELGRAMGLFWA